jgi:hypothetical protein
VQYTKCSPIRDQILARKPQKERQFQRPGNKSEETVEVWTGLKYLKIVSNRRLFEHSDETSDSIKSGTLQIHDKYNLLKEDSEHAVS